MAKASRKSKEKSKTSGPPKTKAAATRVMASYPYERCRALQHRWDDHGPVLWQGRAIVKTYRCGNCTMLRRDVIFSNGEKDTSYERPADYSLKGWDEDLRPGRADWRRVQYTKLVAVAEKPKR